MQPDGAEARMVLKILSLSLIRVIYKATSRLNSRLVHLYYCINITFVIDTVQYPIRKTIMKRIFATCVLLTVDKNYKAILN
jgi:hypothetical protein